MSTLPSVVQSSLGHTLHLTKQIGKGGEGAVYETRERNDIAVKLYWPDKAQSRREKIATMAVAQWYKTNLFVAFPIDVLFSANGAFAGFIMKRVGGSRPIHMLFTPASRKVEFSQANYRFLIRAAANVARAVASVHAIGCVIGDVNHSGFLIADNATSTLIDSDSFQIVASNRKFLCQVGTPEYTPPELQGKRFDQITRTANHDNFGLAVLVFQILFMGRHPYSGRFQGAGDMPLERSIGEYRFAYSLHLSRTRMLPPPGAPLLTDFPPFIGETFEKTFGPSGPNGRTTAAEWVSILQSLEPHLVQCAAEPSHQHIKDKSCPWCRVEQSSPGFITFNAVGPATVIPSHIDLSQIVGIVNAIRDPGPTPAIQTVLVSHPNISPVSGAAELVTKLRRRAYVGAGASAVGAILVCYGDLAAIPGLLALGMGIIVNAIAPRDLRKLRKEQADAEASWRAVEDAWSKHPGNTSFLRIKAETDDLIRALGDLPNEEKRQLQRLEQNKRDFQLRRHLDRSLIANAKIRKVGSGRKAVLASFGIQTAADIDAQRISAIQGFGPALVTNLIEWQQSVARKFIFNASEPLNLHDVATVKARIANSKNELDKRIRESIKNLEQAANFAVTQRAKLTTAANQSFAAREQAEINVQSVTGPFHKASKIITLCCAGLAGIGLINWGRETTPKPPPRPATVLASARPPTSSVNKTEYAHPLDVPKVAAPEHNGAIVPAIKPEPPKVEPPERDAIKPEPPKSAPPERDALNPQPPMVASQESDINRTGEMVKARSVQSDNKVAAAQLFVSNLEERWSTDGIPDLGWLSSIYADEIDYYGKRLSRKSVISDKRTFATKWSRRRYVVQPNSMSARCDNAGCEVTGVVQFTVPHPAQQVSSQGTATFSYSLVSKGDSFVIIRESGSVLRREVTRDNSSTSVAPARRK